MNKLGLLLKGCSYAKLRCLKTIQRNIATTCTARYQWEPSDLKLEPDIPEYEKVNIKMKGYDFAVLESYSKFVSLMAERMNLESEKWAVPAQKFNIKTLQFNTQNVTDEIEVIEIYERLVQLQNLPSTKFPLFLEMIWNNAPEGVNVTIVESTDKEEEFIYVPDHRKRRLEAAIEDLEIKKKKK